MPVCDDKICINNISKSEEVKMFRRIKSTEKGGIKSNSLRKTDEIHSFNYCLGEVLRDIRYNDIQLTQKELAEKIGVTQVTISKSENGNSTASVYLLYRYCDEAGLDPQEAIRRLNDLLNI